MKMFVASSLMLCLLTIVIVQISIATPLPPQLAFRVLQKNVRSLQQDCDTTLLKDIQCQLEEDYPEYLTTRDSSIIEMFAYLYGAKGFFYGCYNLAKEAENCYDSLIFFHKRNNSKLLGRDYYDKILCYQSSGSNIDAIKSLDRALFFAKDDTLKADIYIELNKIYQDLGEYKKALLYNQSALVYATKIGDIDNIGKIYVDRSAIFYDYGFWDSCYFCLNKALELENLFLDEEVRTQILFLVHLNLGNYYLVYEDFNKALYHYELSKRYLSSEATDYVYHDWLIQNNLSSIYTRLFRYDKGTVCLDSALGRLNYTYPSQKHVYRAQSYQTMGDNFSFRGLYLDGLAAYQKAIAEATPNFEEGDVICNPSAELLHKSTMKSVLFDVLIKKGKLLGAMKNDEVALNTFLCADTLIDYMREEQLMNDSKLFWRKRGNKLYKEAMVLSYKLKNKPLSFYLLEKSRSVILLDEISRHYAQSVLPDSVRLRLMGLKQRMEAGDKQTERLEASRMYEQLSERIDENYPIYHQLKTDISFTKVGDIRNQNFLRPNDTFLSYLVADSAIYVYVVKENEDSCYKLPKYVGMEYDILRLSELITSDSIALDWVSYKDEYKLLANRLYNGLLRGIALPKDGRVVVSLDDILWQVPFEALMNEGEYLIQSHEVEYVYSASFLVKTVDNWRSVGNEGWLVFAPVKCEHLSALYETDKAIGYLKAQKPTMFNVFTNQMATKNKFLEEAAHANYIWLATHATGGNLGGEEPCVFFADSALLLSELYAIPFKAKTVILSACETQKGEIVQGEGIMSLARGFAYSGTPLVIAAKWQVDEAKTMDIMKRFFVSEEEDVVKKLTEIKRFYSQEDAPFYWAGIHIIGHQPVVRQADVYIVYGLLGCVVVGLVFLFFYKRVILSKVSIP